MKSKKGCVQTTHQIHEKSIRVEAEKSGQGMKPGPAMDRSVRAAYIVGDGVRINQKIINASTAIKCDIHDTL